MALVAQQALHNVAVISGQQQPKKPGRMECTAGGGGGCRDRYSRQVLFHLPGGRLPVSRFVSSCGQALTNCPRLTNEVFAIVNCLPQRHWIGILGVYGRSSQRRRAGGGDGNGHSSEEETKGMDDGADEKEGESLEELIEEVEKAQGNEQSDKQESQGGNGEGNREGEADRKKTVVQSEDFKTTLWRKVFGSGENVEDEDSLGPEEELLLQDLETLRFNWRGLLDPTLENVLALSFTALLTFALVKILTQLVLVVMTILIAALKYTVLAAFLLGLLIFLL